MWCVEGRRKGVISSCTQYAPPSPVAAQALRSDPKVVAFYSRLRSQQLAALGLDASKFKTLY